VVPTPSAPLTDVTVQAGFTLTQLVAYANANSLTLPLGTIPGYLDLTIGGLLATGGHGHGPPGSSNIVSDAHQASERAVLTTTCSPLANALHAPAFEFVPGLQPNRCYLVPALLTCAMPCCAML
jgi:hypothetical protein